MASSGSALDSRDDSSVSCRRGGRGGGGGLATYVPWGSSWSMAHQMPGGQVEIVASGRCVIDQTAEQAGGEDLNRLEGGR